MIKLPGTTGSGSFCCTGKLLYGGIFAYKMYRFLMSDRFVLIDKQHKFIDNR